MTDYGDDPHLRDQHAGDDDGRLGRNHRQVLCPLGETTFWLSAQDPLLWALSPLSCPCLHPVPEAPGNYSFRVAPTLQTTLGWTCSGCLMELG